MIRRAKEKDITTINKLLSEVLEIHHKIRPDIFISGTTKYTNEELKDIISNDATPIFVYVDDSDNVLGYAFCVIKSSNEYLILDISVKFSLPFLIITVGLPSTKYLNLTLFKEI